MNNRWLLIASLLAGSSPVHAKDFIPVETPPKVEDASNAVDKAAAHDASGDADQWAGKNKEQGKEKEKPAVQPETTQEPVKAEPVEAPKAAKESKKADAAPVRAVGLNEMTGKLESKSYDPKTLRLSVNGGYNVEFTYDKTTKMVNGGSPVTIDDLEYGDELIIRYAGKELQAVEIDRVRKAPRPQ